MNKQRGFTLVEGLLIALIIVVVGFAGYTIWNNNQDNDTTTGLTSNEKQPSEEPCESIEEKSPVSCYEANENTVGLPEGWNTFEFKSGGISYSYPSDWTIIENLCDGSDTYVHLFTTKTDGPPCGTDGGSEIVFVLDSTIKACDSERQESSYERICTEEVYGNNIVVKEKTTVTDNNGFYEKGTVFYAYFLDGNDVYINYDGTAKVSEVESVISTIKTIQ